MEVVDAIDDGCAGSACDAIVVGFANSAESGDVVFDEEVLSQIRNTLFGDDEVGFESEDGVAHALDLFFFNLEDAVPVFFFADLDIGL